MGKVLKIIFITIAVMIGAAVAVLVALMIKSHFDSLKPHLTGDYYTDFKSDYELEKKYAGLGSYEVANADYDAGDKKIGKYRVWYPKELESNQQEYPLIVITNASNVAAMNYEPYFQRLASWGFIVAGNEDRQAGSGESTSLTLDCILRLNDKSDSVFYKKISQTNIGIMGFSQGGAGAIRAATEFENSNRYKRMFTGSAAYPFLAKNMGWEYDASKISIPYFMAAGTGSSDDAGVENIYEKFGGVCPLEALKDIYNMMSQNTTKIRARIKGAEHEDMPTLTEGNIAFAANQRDEVRDLHDVAGALGAQAGMKQQTFIAESAPVLCLNDQGGQVMNCSVNITGTLRAQERGHQPLVYENHGIDSRYTGPHEVSPTISARCGTGGNNVPLVEQDASIYCIVGNIIDRQPENGGNGCGYQEGISYTLTAMDRHAIYSRQRVDMFAENEVVSTESARQHKDATDLVMQPYQETVGTLVRSDHKGISNQYVSDDKCILDSPNLIRRLTPLECERLQGFPDGWTNIPGASDSARYKALGNSVAIPCVEYVMRGIAMVLQNERRCAGS